MSFSVNFLKVLRFEYIIHGKSAEICCPHNHECGSALDKFLAAPFVLKPTFFSSSYEQWLSIRNGQENLLS